jgi:hypothetical protein
MLDLMGFLNLKKQDVESFAWQNEFESLTALTMLVPDYLLKYITNPFANSAVFLQIVEEWPAAGELAQKIRKDKDPDDVVDAMRLIHQDLVTGKVSTGSLLSIFFKVGVA